MKQKATIPLVDKEPFPRWVYKAIVAVWLALFVAAFAWLSRPVPEKPPPLGWQNWRNFGAVKALATGEDGVFVGGPHGLFHLTAQGLSRSIELPGLKGPIMINALLLSKNGVLWVAHDQGLSYRIGEKWQTITRVNGLPSEKVLALAKTKDGTMWAGTSNGAVRLEGPGPWSKESMTILTPREGLLHEIVSAIIEDTEGGIWFGNYAAPAGGLSRLKDRKWRYWTSKNGLPHSNITSLMLDREGRIWAGCGLFNRGGAIVFRKSSGDWQPESSIPQTELAGPKVRSLLQDSRELIWLGSEYDGLTIRQNNKTLHVLTVDDGLAGQEIMSMAEADDGSIWLGTIKGLTHIEHDALMRLLPE